MNIDTGQLVNIPAGTTEEAALLQRLVPIDIVLATEKQKSEMRVDTNDTRSKLGRVLRAWRSKYVPHVGAKQLAKKRTP